MPLYEYGCQNCGTRIEVRHGVTEAPATRCAACGGALERVFTVPGGNTRRLWSPWATFHRSSPVKAR